MTGDEPSPKPLTAGDVSLAFTFHAPVMVNATRPLPLNAAGNGYDPSKEQKCSDVPGMNQTSVNAQIGIDPTSASYGDYDHYVYLYQCQDPNGWGLTGVPSFTTDYYGYWSNNTGNPGWPTWVLAHEFFHQLGESHDHLLGCTSNGIAAPTGTGDCPTDRFAYVAGNDVMGRFDVHGSLLTPDKKLGDFTVEKKN